MLARQVISRDGLDDGIVRHYSQRSQQNIDWARERLTYIRQYLLSQRLHLTQSDEHSGLVIVRIPLLEPGKYLLQGMGEEARDYIAGALRGDGWHHVEYIQESPTAVGFELGRMNRPIQIRTVGGETFDTEYISGRTSAQRAEEVTVTGAWRYGEGWSEFIPPRQIAAVLIRAQP